MIPETVSGTRRMLALIAGVCGLALPARAVTIDLGLYPNPPGGDNAANELAFLNTTVIPTYNATQPGTINDLPGALAGSDNVDVSGELLQIGVNVTAYEYIKLKWGNNWQYYYIAGETGTKTFTSTGLGPNGQQQALSHYTLFNSTLAPQGPGQTPGPSVPDGGATVAMLGAAICGLALVRRFV